jgi:hypothetical protein
MSGASHRQNGDRVECEIVARHLELGIHSERVPLSGASRYEGNGADVELYINGREEAWQQFSMNRPGVAVAASVLKEIANHT